MSVGVARPAPWLSRGIDCLMPLSRATVAAFRADGFVYFGRYLENLTVQERDDIFAEGGAVWLLSEAYMGLMSQQAGDQKGAAIVKRADALEAPKALHVTIDLEETAATTGEATAYVAAFARQIRLSGRVTELYVGAQQPLGSLQLYGLVDVHLYCRAASVGIPEPGCGFAHWQIGRLDKTLHGQRIDGSVTGEDARGRAPILWWPT